MTTQPGSAGTAGRDYRVPAPVGRHRAPPPVPTPRAPTVVAVAAAVLTAASLTAIATSAPDASSAERTQVSTVTRAQRTTAGPLVIPSIGASGAWSPPEETQTAVRPVSVTTTPVRTRRPSSTSKAVTEAYRATVAPSEQTVIPEPQPVTEEQTAEPTPTTPLADPIAADTSATPTSEEQPVPTPTESSVTVDVTGEVVP